MKKFVHKCFVSSTFVDFHAERDEILRRIHPAFRDAAVRHGHDAELVELRWGVDTVDLEQAELANRVLKTCLNAVDESRPAMMIYIGDRLGWIPRREWIPDEIALKFKPNEIDGQSITGLEIIYGLKESEDSGSPRCVICMRDLSGTHIPEEFRETYFELDPVKQKTLENLKTWLREKFGDKIIDYTADFNVETKQLENFRVKDSNTPLAEAVTDKLIAEFSDDWSEYDALPWTQRELVSAEHFAVNTATSFVGRAELIADLKSKLENSQVIFLRGVHGSGKTAIACKLASDLLQENRKVCFIACGGSANSSQLILRQLIFFMEHEVLGLESTLAPSADYEQSKNYFFSLCQRVSADRQIYIVFDAVEMISDERRRTLDFIPTDREKIQCLVTCTNDFEIPAKFFDTTAKFQNLDDEDILQIFLHDEHVDNLQDLEEVTRKKFVKFFKLFFSMSDDQVQELLQSLPNDLVGFAVNAFKNSPAALNSMMPRKFLTIDIPELNDDEIVPVLEGMLARKDKMLYAATAQEVLKHKSARNPLWLKMVEVMLNMIAGEELLDPKIRRNSNFIVNLTVDFVKAVPDDPSEAAKYVLDRAVEKLCGNSPVIHEAVRLLGVSRRGLQLKDIRDMIGEAFISLKWAFLQLYLRDSYLIERDGNQLEFAHGLIRKGIRDAISDNEFTRLEARIGEHIGKLAENDPLRRTDGMYYAKRLKNYELAVELFVQAFRTKDTLLSAEIYHVLCDDEDGAKFVMDCFRNIKDCDEETARDFVSFFIGDGFDKAMLGGSQTTLQLGRDLYAVLAEIFAKSIGTDSVLCQRMRSSQAMYELRLDNGDDAKKIYEEIFKWGNENIDTLIKNLDACRLLSTCCDQLAELAARKGDHLGVQRYAEENLRWSDAALAIDRTSERDPYAILTLFKKIALKIRKGHGKATAEILDMAREAYGLSKNIFKKNPNDFMSLSFLCKACSTLINISVSLDQPKAALSLIAEEGERHVRHLLQYDANNLEATGIAVALLREIVIAQFKTYNFKHAVENSLETMRLLNQIYFQNPSNETAALIQEVAEEFKSVAYLSCYEINRLLEHEPTEENQKIILEASEAMEAFSNLDALNKILGLSLE